MSSVSRTLRLLPETFTICRLASNTPIPVWAMNQQVSFFSIVHTCEELSIICPQSQIPSDTDDMLLDTGWRCLKLEGPFELDEPGVLASLVSPLAQAGISVFAQATYDTDYLVVNQLDKAIQALESLQHQVITEARSL
jgi:hypothetical protein